MSDGAALVKGTEVAKRGKTMTLAGDQQQANGAHGEELMIPRIPDAITINNISTKLPWRDIHTLALVSRGWFRAIRSRHVYGARIRSNTRETLYISNESPSEPVHAITLLTLEDDGSSSCCELPPISSEYFVDAVCPSGRCVALDGRIYVFGGLDCKVHVLDVAGLGQWQQCASTLKPREEFGCGVMDGKIYAFGGAVNHEDKSEYELYNETEDTWSKVRPLVSLHCGQHVGRVQKQFLVRGTKFLHPETIPRQSEVRADGSRVTTYVPRRSAASGVHEEGADLLEEYDPIRDEWSLVEPVGGPNERLFVGGGLFCSMSPSRGIFVYDFDGRSWTHLHLFSFAAAVGPVDDSVELWPVGVLTDDHELLAYVDWPGTDRACLVQSSGFGTQENELVWEKAKFAIPYEYGDGVAVHLDKSILL